jgi:hypothetical protein
MEYLGIKKLTPRYARSVLQLLTNAYWLSLTQNAVDLGAAHWANALCHTTTRIRDLYVTFKGTLLFALNAVGLALIFLGHNDPPIAARA